MKENRFIELLNLFVDQQLTAAEAVELEAELQRNPDRRRTYQQYCKMQKACTLLFEQECQNAPSNRVLARALAKVDRKVEESPVQFGRIAWFRRVSIVGGIAAMAACAAFVFVRQTGVVAHQVAGSDVAGTAQKPALESVSTEANSSSSQAVSIPPADPKVQLAKSGNFTILPTRIVLDTETSADESEGPDFAWMGDVKLMPMRVISAEELVAGAKKQTNRVPAGYASGATLTQPVFENAAFQVKKGN